MTEKGRNVLNLINKYKIYYGFTASDLSQLSCEKIYPATLTSLVKEGVLSKISGSNPSVYKINSQYKVSCDNKEEDNYIWGPLMMSDNNIIESKDFDVPIEISSNGLMKLKTDKNIIMGKNVDFFNEEVPHRLRYMLWNIMNNREDLKFIIYTFNNKYNELLPDNWGNGYSNVDIKLLRDKNNIKVCSKSEYLNMNNYEQELLWNYCIDLLRGWNKDKDDIVLNHNECFLVGYLYLFLELTKLDKNISEAEIALLSRLSREEVDRIMIIGKDISKRGIPIYKEFDI